MAAMLCEFRPRSLDNGIRRTFYGRELKEKALAPQIAESQLRFHIRTRRKF